MSGCVTDGCSRVSGLLAFPERLCWPHTSDAQRDLVRATNDRARLIGVDEDTWPYGPNISVTTRVALVDWAETHSYALAKKPAGCLHWLTGQSRRCRALQDRWHAGTTDRVHSLLDHSTFWTRDGKPALILAQPYSVDRTALAEYVHDWPVHVSVSRPGPWYGFGTWGIEITAS